MVDSIYFQIRNPTEWIATTDRSFVEGDRIVHLFGGHNGTTTCPARGVVTRVDGECLAIKLYSSQIEMFYPEEWHIVKESDFIAARLESID